jgi:hypothetical protein
MTIWADDDLGRPFEDGWQLSAQNFGAVTRPLSKIIPVP